MSGDVMMELTSADIPGALDAVTNEGIILADLNYTTALSVRFRVRRQDAARVQSISEKRGDTLKMIRRLGLYWRVRNLGRHWVLVSGLIFLLILTVWLPTRVFFFRVEGNEKLHSKQILEEAARCGIYFGAERSVVRSERLKNSLLEAIPQLQWAAVNTEGCVAVITVEERQLPEDGKTLEAGSLVAIRDGIVLEVTAVRGTAMVKPGQAVRAGDVLISGYTDCGGVILHQGADGEVYGRTLHQITAKTPDRRQVRGDCYDKKQKIALVIGKKRINFYEDSGILDTGCVKMYAEYYLTLPGGLTLPVKLLVETQIRYDLSEDQPDPGNLESLLSEQAKHYLQTQMIAGSVLSARAFMDGCCYSGEFVCHEMIGRMVYEEIITDYGEDR